MKLIRLTNSNVKSGRPIWVNRDAIIWLEAANAGATSTIIYFSNDQSVSVAGPPDDTARLLEE